MSLEQAQQFRDEFAKREALDERAIAGCPKCVKVPYSLVAARVDVGSFAQLAGRACYAKPCDEHAHPVRLYPWIEDVPLEALSAWLERREAFALHALRGLLPKDHPSYEAPAACYAEPVRLSLEHGRLPMHNEQTEAFKL